MRCWNCWERKRRGRCEMDGGLGDDVGKALFCGHDGVSDDDDKHDDNDDDDNGHE